MSTPGLASRGSSSEVEFSSVMPSSARTFATAPKQRIRVASSEREQKLGQTPIWPDAGEDLLMLDLSRHDGTLHAFALECVDQPGKFSQRKPMNSSSAVGFDLWRSLFFNGSDDDFDSPRRGLHRAQEKENDRCPQ